MDILSKEEMTQLIEEIKTELKEKTVDELLNEILSAKREKTLERMRIYSRNYKPKRKRIRRR